MCSGNPMIFLLPPCPTDENMGVPNQKRHNFWEICHPLTKILGTSWVLRIVEKHQVCAFEFMWHVSSSNWQCFPRSNRSELLKCLEPLFSIHNPYLVPHLCYPQFYDLPSCKQKMCLHPLDVWSGTLPGHKGATTSVRSRRPVEQCRLGWLGTMDMIHMSSKVHIYIHINIYTYYHPVVALPGRGGAIIHLIYVWTPGGGTPLGSTFLYETKGVTNPQRDVWNIDVYSSFLFLSGVCMRITGVSCKHTFIASVNHCYIVWRSWGKYRNHPFDIISVLNINVWHAGGSVSPKQLMILHNIGYYSTSWTNCLKLGG